MSHRSEPTDAGDVLKKERASIRKKYRQNLSARRKVLPGQRELITDTVLILKLVNYDNQQIGKIVGISRDQVSEIVNEPKTAERFMKLKKTLSQAAYELIQTYLIEAVQTVADVMRTAEDDGMRLKAAGELFDRGGLPKASRTESDVHKVDEKKHTITDDGLVEALRELPADKQEVAAQMIEDLTNFIQENFVKPKEPENEPNG